MEVDNPRPPALGVCKSSLADEAAQFASTNASTVSANAIREVDMALGLTGVQFEFFVFECTPCNTNLLTTGSGCSTKKGLESKFGFEKN